MSTRRHQERAVEAGRPCHRNSPSALQTHTNCQLRLAEPPPELTLFVVVVGSASNSMVVNLRPSDPANQ